MNKNSPSGKSGKENSLQNNSWKWRRDDAKRSANREASDEGENGDNENLPIAVRTTIEPMTGMEGEIEYDEEVYDIPTPPFEKATRRLPPSLWEGTINFSQGIMEIMKEANDNVGFVKYLENSNKPRNKLR